MTRTLRILIADDEAMARKRLQRLLGDMPDVELLAVCKDGDEVLAALRVHEPDVLLLDIRMPGRTGLEASALLPAGGPAVIFATAHPEHAVDAFDVGAGDYLLKPVEAGRLRKALDRVRAGRAAATGAGAGTGSADMERLALPTARGARLLDRAAVTHALFDGTSTLVCTADRTVFTTLSLSEIERRLGGEPFVRVHRRALVNLNAVELLEPQETGGLLARIGEHRIEVSRQAARALRKRLGL